MWKNTRFDKKFRSTDLFQVEKTKQQQNPGKVPVGPGEPTGLNSGGARGQSPDTDIQSQTNPNKSKDDQLFENIEEKVRFFRKKFEDVIEAAAKAKASGILPEYYHGRDLNQGIESSMISNMLESPEVKAEIQKLQHEIKELKSKTANGGTPQENSKDTEDEQEVLQLPEYVLDESGKSTEIFKP